MHTLKKTIASLGFSTALVLSLSVLPAIAGGKHSYSGATSNDTPYSTALYCLKGHATTKAPVIAVGRINDMTGKYDFNTGAKVTQGASLFAITALGKAGIPVVERLDNSISEIEMNYARQHLLSDSPELAGKDPDNYRRIYKGQIAGSQYYIVGGVTELNNNIKSTGFQGVAGYTDGKNGNLKGQISSSDYVLNIAVDLRLVDTRTQQVLRSVTYQKQILGHEFDTSLGGSVNKYGLGASGGNSRLEPVQAGVRALIELSVFDLVEGVYTNDRSSGCL